MTRTEPFLIRAARQIGAELPNNGNRVMFAPGGIHTLTPAFGPAVVEVTIKIDSATANVLNASLAQVNAANAPQRAFFDKNHEGKEAMAWPIRFEWSELPEPGVYAVVEWTDLGRQYVTGKVMRAFSGSFFTDADLPKKPRAGQVVTIAAGKRGSATNPARMVGLAFPDAGTLTNDPAFRKILPLWASARAARNTGGGSAAGLSSTQQQNLNTMKLTAEQKAALQASIQTLEQDIVALRAQHQANPNDAAIAEQIGPKETELDSAKAKIAAHDLAVKNEGLETALLAQRTRDAETAITAAITRGAIAPKDTELQETWKKMLIEDPAKNTPLLNAMRGSPALQQPRITLSGISVQREDSVTVLKAYNAERDPNKKAAIYARELSERITKGEDLPIHAANTLGTLSGEIVAQRALELLTLEEPMLNMFSTDFSDESAKLNQQITSRIVGIPTAGSYDVDNGYASQNQVMTDVPVTITAHRFTQAEFGANEIAGTSRRLFDEIAPAQADAIGADAISIALAVITAANFTNETVQAEVDFDRATVISMGGALRDRGVRRNRFLLLTGAYYDKLFNDQAIVTLAGNQRADLITNDEMIPIHNFNVFRAPTLPATGNLKGFGGGKSSVVVAGRVPSDYANALPGATGGGTSQIITNAKSGLSVHLVQFVDHKLGKAYSRMAYMLGAAKGQTAAGQRLVSVATA